MADTMKLKFNPDDFTLGDLEDFEEGVGSTLQEALRRYPTKDDNGDPATDETGRPVMEVRLSSKALVYIVWILKRAEDSAYTLAQARGIKVTELEITGSDDDDSDAEGNAAEQSEQSV